jgi:aminoglycoside phosphotransferase (APT) family kinase protein
MLASSLVTSGPSAQWTADFEVTPAAAAQVIGHQFPELRDHDVTLLATGWDNNAFAVGSRWLFRFPRREVALPGVRREIALLPLLASRLPLPIPDPCFIGQPSPAYPWPFFGARLLPGSELADSDLSSGEVLRTAASLGRFLRELHDPGLVPDVRHADLPIDPMGRADPRLRASRARQALDRLARHGSWEPDAVVLELLDLASAAPARPPADGAAELVVSHGDLHIRHVLVSRAGQVSGVIDWGDLSLGDPAVDLSIAYFGFCGHARAELLSAYGRAVGAHRELAARTLAVWLAASLAEYAADEGRDVLLAKCLAGLKNAAAA